MTTLVWFISFIGGPWDGHYGVFPLNADGDLNEEILIWWVPGERGVSLGHVDFPEAPADAVRYRLESFKANLRTAVYRHGAIDLPITYAGAEREAVPV